MQWNKNHAMKQTAKILNELETWKQEKGVYAKEE